MFVVLSVALEAMLDGFREAMPRKSKVMTNSLPYPFVSVCLASIPFCVSIFLHLFVAVIPFFAAVQTVLITALSP